jgi:hypothetical protein
MAQKQVSDFHAFGSPNLPDFAKGCRPCNLHNPICDHPLAFHLPISSNKDAEVGM